MSHNSVTKCQLPTGGGLWKAEERTVQRCCSTAIVHTGNVTSDFFAANGMKRVFRRATKGMEFADPQDRLSPVTADHQEEK
jgi:hypothetical protein